MSRDFIAILTPPAKTFPDISIGDPDKHDLSKPDEYDYYAQSSLYVVPELSVPDFLVTRDTKELCGIIYRFELKDLGHLKWVTSTLDKKTYCVTMPGSPLLESKTRPYHVHPKFSDLSTEHLGAFEIIWSKQENLFVYKYSEFFGLYWLFKVKEEGYTLSGIQLEEHELDNRGLVLLGKDKFLY